MRLLSIRKVRFGEAVGSLGAVIWWHHRGRRAGSTPLYSEHL